MQHLVCLCLMVIMERIILYHCTKDVVWIKTLPESQPALGIQSMRDRMIDEANLDFEQSQTYLDRASSLERKFGQAYIYISLTDLAKNINV